MHLGVPVASVVERLQELPENQGLIAGCSVSHPENDLQPKRRLPALLRSPRSVNPLIGASHILGRTKYSAGSKRLSTAIPNTRIKRPTTTLAICQRRNFTLLGTLLILLKTRLVNAQHHQHQQLAAAMICKMKKITLIARPKPNAIQPHFFALSDAITAPE